jgi:predicted RecB family nuclease
MAHAVRRAARRADDHLCLVAGISKLQINEPRKQGINTTVALAGVTPGTEDVHGEGHGGGHERASSSRMTRLASTEASRPDNEI